MARLLIVASFEASVHRMPMLIGATHDARQAILDIEFARRRGKLS
ncbi:hypothetical protein [Chitinasiproducens palmae]|nr:hypothetical protein [Chitinasiproducens palmae]